MVSALAYRRKKREKNKKHVSKHDVYSGNSTWARRREVGRLSPRREAKLKGKNVNRKRVLLKKQKTRGDSWSVKGDGEIEQSGSSCGRAQQEIEHVCVDG